MESVQRVARELETGDGPLARLLRDRELADRLAATVGRLEGLLVQAQEGEGLLPQLLTDAETRRKFTAAVDGLSEASADLARFTEKLESSEGLMQKLLTDEAYAREVTENLRQMVERLNLLSEKLTAGEGTAAKLINDPAIYEAINDIVVGIEESRLLRWLIRNRQKAGIEKRYDDARKAPAEEGSGEAAPAPP
jgi:hypothetical protein